MPFNAYKTVLGILMTLLQHFFFENHVIFNFNFTFYESDENTSALVKRGSKKKNR